MRIAFIVRSFPKISETFILNQIVGLIERGYKVHIYSIYPGEKDIVHLEYKQYKLFEKTYYLPQVPENPSLRIIKAIYSLITNYGYISRSIKSLNIFKYGRAATLLYLFYFSSLIKERRDYDIIHCHFGICGLVGVALRDLGLLTGKIITSFHGMDVNIYPRLYGKNVYSQLFNQGDLYTVNSNYTSKKLVGLGCPKHKITKLCVGVNISQYSFREKFLSSGENIKILTVARLVEKKRN